ncbi:MAG: ATP-binding cassette domain-containing protein [Rhizobiaceae bacterium]
MNRQAADSRRSWRLATAFAFAALLCGVALGGLSAWFLGSVALAGLTASAFAFNFHIPGALVRLFAVGRTAARYGERLAGHRAALTDQVSRRVRLFAAMAAAPAMRRAGWQLGQPSRLADYIDDVEDVDYAWLRAGLPALTLGCGTALCVLATAFVAPAAILLILSLFLATLILGSRVAKTGAMAWERARSLRRDGAHALGAAMASAVPLKAERFWAAASGEALAKLSEAETEMLLLRRRQAGFDMLAGLLGPLAGLAVVAAAWMAGARGEALLLPVFIAFAWIALGEGFNGASRLLVATLRRKAALAELGRWSAPFAQGRVETAAPRLAMLRHGGLRRLAPDGRPIGAPIALSLKAGRPTVLAGASGSGKTSLLKQIAGWIGDDVLLGEHGPFPAASRRALTMLCLHDAAILDDTVRANLFAAGRSEAELWQAIEAVELGDRIRQAGGLDGWLRQDLLSLGEAQRLNLARAFLSDRPVVLLDEPTEHLDDAQGGRILARLLHHLRGRIVVLSSHRTVGRRGVSLIELGP